MALIIIINVNEIKSYLKVAVKNDVSDTSFIIITQLEF